MFYQLFKDLEGTGFIVSFGGDVCAGGVMLCAFASLQHPVYLQLAFSKHAVQIGNTCSSCVLAGKNNSLSRLRDKPEKQEI